MTNGTAAAGIIGAAILGRDNAWAEVFDPQRATLKASLSKFVLENLKVVKHWAGDRVVHPTRGKVDELRAGEAAVIGVGPRQTAVYVDEGGEVHAVSATCTHLGCSVAWNAAERTWDCPCHGSRFDPDGRVIQGPAVKDLKQR